MRGWRTALTERRVIWGGGVLLLLALASFAAPVVTALFRLDPDAVDLQPRHGLRLLERQAMLEDGEPFALRETAAQHGRRDF